MQAEDAGIREMRGRPWRQRFDEALRSAENQLAVQGAPAGTRGVEELHLDGACTCFAVYLYVQRLGAGRTASVHCCTGRAGTPGSGQARKWRYE